MQKTDIIFQIRELPNQLEKLKKELFTGCFSLEVRGEFTWTLYFRVGRISWQSGGINPGERWQRYLKQFLPNLPSKESALYMNLKDANQQYQCLVDLLRKRLISRDNVGNFIDSIITESLLDISINCYQNKNVKIRCTTNTEKTLKIILHLLDCSYLVKQVTTIFSQWNNSQLASYSPNFYPIVEQSNILEEYKIDPENSFILSLIDGTVSIHNIAWQTKKSIVEIADFLAPLVIGKIISLSPVAVPQKANSLKNKIEKLPPSSSSQILSSTKQKYLIGCVDDSLLVCQNLESIVAKAGYNFLGIQDPTRAVMVFLKNKPDFIFLDLIMPVVNGYELCSHLRRVPIFKDIPIVILTGKDGLVDRMRAKMIGSTDFISKPVDEKLVIEMINKHISIRR